jgi:hypothetical protein
MLDTLILLCNYCATNISLLYNWHFLLLEKLLLMIRLSVRFFFIFYYFLLYLKLQMPRKFSFKNYVLIVYKIWDKIKKKLNKISVEFKFSKKPQTCISKIIIIIIKKKKKCYPNMPLISVWVISWQKKIGLNRWTPTFQIIAQLWICKVDHNANW